MTPVYVALGPEGKIYVADAANHRIQVFNSTGEFLFKTGSEGTGDGQFKLINDLAVGDNGNIYVADRDRVQIFSPTGNFISKFGGAGTTDGLFSFTSGLAIDELGMIYVVDRDNYRVQVFNSAGIFIRKFGSYGKLDGQLILPERIAMGNNNDVFVLDYSSSLIHRFTLNGIFLNKFTASDLSNISIDKKGNIVSPLIWKDEIQILTDQGALIKKIGTHNLVDGKFVSPSSISLDKNGNIYVSDLKLNRVQVFDQNSVLIDKFGSYGNGTNQFYYLNDMSVDDQLNRYALDLGFSQIKIFDSNWNLLRKFGSSGTGNGQFKSATGLEIHPNGNIFVLDRITGYVTVFDKTGGFISKFGSIGSNQGQFEEPTDISIDKNGTVYVSDFNKHNIQVFTETGAFIREIKYNEDFTMTPFSLTVDNDGLIYVTDYFSPYLLIFKNNGDLLTKFDGKLKGASGIFVDENKKIYIADTESNRVQIFAPSSKVEAFIVLDDFQSTYGDASFSLTATSNSTGEISYSIVPDAFNTGAVSLSGAGNKIVTILKAGKVKIRASVAAAGNYAASSKDITLTINKAVLTATANNASRSYGNENPTFSTSYTGFKYNDNESVLDSKPVLSTIATSTTHWGSYPITPASGVDDSYDFSYVDGTLFVTKAQQTISFDLIPDQLTTSPDFTLSASSTANLPITYSVSKGKDLVTLSDSKVTLTGRPGNVTIVAYQEGNDYYHDASASQTFEIIQNVVSGLDESTDGIYVGPNPASDLVIIRVPSYGESLSVTLADLQGKVISSNLITGQDSLSIPVAGLPKGMYIIGLYSKEQVLFRKIIVQ